MFSKSLELQKVAKRPLMPSAAGLEQLRPRRPAARQRRAAPDDRQRVPDGRVLLVRGEGRGVSY
jgi:hypothetical protein